MGLRVAKIAMKSFHTLDLLWNNELLRTLGNESMEMKRKFAHDCPSTEAQLIGRLLL